MCTCMSGTCSAGPSRFEFSQETLKSCIVCYLPSLEILLYCPDSFDEECDEPLKLRFLFPHGIVAVQKVVPASSSAFLLRCDNSANRLVRFHPPTALVSRSPQISESCCTSDFECVASCFALISIVFEMLVRSCLAGLCLFLGLFSLVRGLSPSSTA